MSVFAVQYKIPWMTIIGNLITLRFGLVFFLEWGKGEEKACTKNLPHMSKAVGPDLS